MTSQRPQTSLHHRADASVAQNPQRANAASTKQRRPRSPRRPDDNRRIRKRPQKPVAEKVRLRMTPAQKEDFIKLCARVTNNGNITLRNVITPGLFEKIADKLKRRYPNQNFTGHKLEYAFKQLRTRWKTYCLLVEGRSVPHDELGIPKLPEKVWRAFLKKRPGDNWLRRESVGDIRHLGNIFWHGVPTGTFCRAAGEGGDIPKNLKDEHWPPKTEAEYWDRLRGKTKGQPLVTSDKESGSSDPSEDVESDSNDDSSETSDTRPSPLTIAMVRFAAMFAEGARRMSRIPGMDDYDEALAIFNREFRDEYPDDVFFELSELLGEGERYRNSRLFKWQKNKEKRREFLDYLLRKQAQEREQGQTA